MSRYSSTSSSSVIVCCPPCGSAPCEYLLERLQRLKPVAVRPQRLTLPPLRLQLEHLALLPHHRPSSIESSDRGITPRRRRSRSPPRPERGAPRSPPHSLSH